MKEYKVKYTFVLETTVLYEDGTTLEKALEIEKENAAEVLSEALSMEEQDIQIEVTE